MRGRLFTFVAVAALLLCTGIVVLWVRSYFVSDAIGWSWETGAVQAGTASGRLRLSQILLLDGSRYGLPHFAHAHYPPSIDPPTRRLPARWSNLGFGYEHQLRVGQNESRMVLLPLWFVVLGMMVLPALWYVRRRGAASGTPICQRCGYDLRATPDRCPECGAVSNRRDPS